MAVMELWRRRDLEGAVKTEYVDGNFFTQDSVGNLVGVKCYKDGAEVALTGSVTGYCVLPSGETVSVAGTRSGNQASILVPQSALAYTGPLGITLKLIDGNTITTLMSIIVVVYRSKTDTVITPSSQIITDWANQISAALQEVEDASAAQDVKIADLKSVIVNDDNIVKTFSATDMVSGVWNFSTPVANSTRLRSKTLLPIKKGTVVRYTNPTQDVYLGVLETATSQSYLQNLVWANAGAVNAEYAINYDGYFVLNIRNHNGGTISVDDYAVNIDLILPPSQKGLEAAKQELLDMLKSRYNGKKISIIGDSIDTFNKAGYKIDGYVMYYPNHGVTDVNQTWWMQVINNSGAQLEVNASYSDSRVTNTHPEGRPDFYDRISLLGDPDLIFVTLGTNDVGVELGEYDYTTPYTDLTESKFRPAYIKGVKGLQALYPDAEIVCVSEAMSYLRKDSICNIAKALGATYIDVSGYATVASGNVHPGPLGMRQIAAKILYPTDSYFMFEGIPADAKKTGEKLTEIKDDADDKFVNDGIVADTSIEWVSNTATTYAYGLNVPTSGRCSCRPVLVPESGMYIYYPLGVQDSDKGRYRVNLYYMTNGEYVKANDYAYLPSEDWFSIPSFIHFDDNLYISITMEKGEFDGSILVSSGSTGGHFDNVPFLFPIYTKISNSGDDVNVDIGSVSPGYYYSYSRSYGTILPLNTVKRIVTAPKYNLIAQIYKVDSNEQLVECTETLFSKTLSNDVEFVEGVPVLDLSGYDYDGFVIIGIISSYYHVGATRKNDAMGQLAKYDDVIANTEIVWKQGINIQNNGAIPAKAKSNIETIKKYTVDHLHRFRYGNWIGSSSYYFPEMNNSNFLFYSGGDHENVPFMHVTYESIKNAALNPNSRLYKEYLDTDNQRYYYGYGAVCSTMMGLITGYQSGIQTSALYLEMLNEKGFETRDIETIEDVRVGDFLLRLDTSTQFEYGHVLYVTNILQMNETVYAIMGIEAYPPFVRYLAFVNYDAYPFNTSTGLFSFYSSREIGGTRYNKAARLDYKKYKTIREAYGYITDPATVNTSGIMCDRGYGSVYCIGQSCQISIDQSISNLILLYRDGVQITTINPSTISNVENNYKVIDIAEYLTSDGEYTLRTDSATVVEKFVVAQAQTVRCRSISGDSEHVRITFTQNGASAIAVKGYYKAGAPINHTYIANFEITDEDRANGYTDLDKTSGVYDYPFDYFDVLYRTVNGTFHVLCYTWDESIIDNDNVTIKQSSSYVGVT